MKTIDLIIGPSYLLIILMGGFFYSQFLPRKYQKWFVTGLSAKLFCSVLFVLLYTVYYNNGDTVSYFKTGNIIVEAFKQDTSDGMKLFFSAANDYSGSNLQYKSQSRFFGSPSSFLNAKVSAIFSMLSFGSFLGASYFFGLIAFAGSWSLYRAICSIYPNREKSFALIILLIPSVVLWSSGIMKDSLVFALMCWSFVFAFKIIKGRFQYLVLFLSCLYFMNLLKGYLAMALIPSFVMMAYVHYSSSFRSPAIRILIQPILLVMMLVIGYTGIQKVVSEDPKYQLDSIVERAEITRNFIYRTSIRGASLQNRTGSEYSLPALTGGASDLAIIPLAINVTLFRPYLIEVRNPVMLLASLESTFFLIATLILLFRIGPGKMLRMISNDPFLMFCAVFSLGFAVAVGFSTYNFGALVRYKIPILPFYGMMLYIINEKFKAKKIKTKMGTIASNLSSI